MPHSSQKNVNAPMDAWDRQRLGLALLEIRAALIEIMPETPQGVEALERVRKAIHRFIEEAD